MNDKPNSDDFLDRRADRLHVAAWLAAVLWFLGVLGYQVLGWLQTGQWKSLPFVVVFNHFDIILDAVYSPQSWIGIARIAQWILGLPLSILGGALIVIVASMIRNIVRGDT